LENRFREALDLANVGTPLRLEFRRTGRSWAESRERSGESSDAARPRPSQTRR
jgi:hypothetical protein